MNNMDIIIKNLLAFHQQMEATGSFSINDLQARMEPVYNTAAPTAHPPRILISFGGGVGDFVLLSPCLREIRRLYGHAFIFLVVSDNAAELAAACPYVDQSAAFGFIHSMNQDTELFYIECVAFCQKYFTEPFDLAFNFASFFTGSLLSYMSGARERFLFLPAEDWPFFHKQIPYKAAQLLSTVPYPDKKLSPHTVDRYLAVLDNLLHYPIADRELETWFTDADLSSVESLLAFDRQNKLIAIGLGGTGNGSKSWPTENYIQLAKQILQNDRHTHFVITGGKNEKDAAALLEKQIPAASITNLTGLLTYRQTAALLSLCNYYIGNDTGTMHLAAASHIPVLVVFNYAASLLPEESSNVERYAPYHVPCVIVQPDNALPECLKHVGHPLQKKLGCVARCQHCITQVTVAEMYAGYLALRDM